MTAECAGPSGSWSDIARGDYAGSSGAETSVYAS